MKGLTAMAALAAFLLLGLSGCGKDEKEDLRRRIVYHPGNSKSIQLEWTVKLHPNGDTSMHGAMKEYYWGGANKKSVEWKDGRKDGSAQAWYDNGSQQWIKSYEKGRKARTWRLFFSDGNPWMVMNFNKEGALEGQVQRWDRMDPGQVREATFANGNCASGDCNILALPEVTDETPPANRNAIARDREIMADFLD